MAVNTYISQYLLQSSQLVYTIKFEKIPTNFNHIIKTQALSLDDCLLQFRHDSLPLILYSSTKRYTGKLYVQLSEHTGINFRLNK